MPQKYPGRFEVSVQTKNESAGVVVDEILKQIRRMRTETVTDQELADAKAYLIGSFPRRLDTGRKIAEFLTSVEFYGLGAGYIGKYKDYISKVTKEDVLRVARTYLNDTTYTLVIVGNQKKLSLDPAAK
jgi:zinc protease